MDAELCSIPADALAADHDGEANFPASRHRCAGMSQPLAGLGGRPT
jgi:hypothetical protein